MDASCKNLCIFVVHDYEFYKKIVCSPSPEGLFCFLVGYEGLTSQSQLDVLDRCER